MTACFLVRGCVLINAYRSRCHDLVCNDDCVCVSFGRNCRILFGFRVGETVVLHFLSVCTCVLFFISIYMCSHLCAKCEEM